MIKKSHRVSARHQFLCRAFPSTLRYDATGSTRVVWCILTPHATRVFVFASLRRNLRVLCGANLLPGLRPSECGADNCAWLFYFVSLNNSLHVDIILKFNLSYGAHASLGLPSGGGWKISRVIKLSYFIWVQKNMDHIVNNFNWKYSNAWEAKRSVGTI